jgi:hypothetical protein
MWAATAMARDTREGGSRDCLTKAVMLRWWGEAGRPAQERRRVAESDGKWSAREGKRCRKGWV